MSTENDDFVEKLLRDLSTAEPLTEFETRKFEKFVDAKAADYKQSQQKNRFRVPTSVAASVAIALGAVFFFTGHNSNQDLNNPLNPNPSASSSNSATGEGASPSESSQPSTKPSTPKGNSGNSSQSSGGDTGQYSDHGAFNSPGNTISRFTTNLDYATDLVKIKSLVALSDGPHSISTLDAPLQQCAIKMGIENTILAYDHGYYDGERVSAFYVGMNKSNFYIRLVDSACTELATLS